MNRTPTVALIFPPIFAPAVAHGAYGAVPALAASLRAQGVRVVSVDLNRRFLADLLEKIRAMPTPPDDPLSLAIRFLQRRSSLGSFDMGLVDLLLALAQNKGLFSLGPVPEQRSYPSQNTFLDFVNRVLTEELAEPVDLAAISLASFEQLPAGLTAARCLKKRALARSVVIGGPAVTLAPLEFLERLLSRADIDGAGLGMGEEVLLSLARASAAGVAAPSIAGLVTRGEPTPPARPPKDLDHLPTPDFSDLPAEVWAAPDRALPIRFALGCAWGRCTFCDSRRIHPRARFRSPHLVAGDLETLARRHGSRRFLLIGDTLPPAYAGRLARELRSRGSDVKWWSYLRVDPAFDRALLAELAEAGCEKVTLGVESTDPRILSAMDKGYGPEAVEPMIDRLLECGISVKVNLIFDFPGQTYDQALKDLSFAQDIVDRVDSLAAFPFVLSRWSRIAESPEKYDIEIPRETEPGERGFVQRDGPHLLDFRRRSGMTRDQVAELAGLYGELRPRDRRSRELCRRLDSPEHDWMSHRYAVYGEDVELCPTTRQVFNAVQKRTHQLSAGGWPLFQRLLSPEGASFEELFRAAAASGASILRCYDEIASFLLDLARRGLLHEGCLRQEPRRGREAPPTGFEPSA